MAGSTYSCANSSRASITSQSSAPSWIALPFTTSKSSPGWPRLTVRATTSASYSSWIHLSITLVSRPPLYSSSTRPTSPGSASYEAVFLRIVRSCSSAMAAHDPSDKPRAGASRRSAHPACHEAAIRGSHHERPACVAQHPDAPHVESSDRHERAHLVPCARHEVDARLVGF